MDNEILDQLQSFLDQADKLYKKGLFQEVETVYKKLLLLLPNHGGLLLRLAGVQYQLGRALDAISNCDKVLALEPDNLDAHQLKSAAMFPGPDYLSLLKDFHNHIQPDAYVEIGVETGRTLALISSSTRALGIDPKLKLEFPLTPLTRTFEMTSDAFFNKKDLLKELGSEQVDMAFIDGLHLFEQALKDFMNLEPFMSDRSLILIHDCFPVDETSAARKRVTEFWSGDTWKIIPCLKKVRPDLDIFTIPTTPSGLGVITGMDPSSTLIKDNLDEIVNQFVNLDFQVLEKDIIKTLNVVPNHWSNIAEKIKQTASIV